MNRYAMFLAMILCIPLLSSCTTCNETSSESVTYEGETYQTVVIGTQIWMARNLNYAVEGSKCYDDNAANCATYGRLYDWATAMGMDSEYNYQEWGGSDVRHKGICPIGWHIPSDAEWTTLTNFVGSSAGTKLKANSSLWYTNTGTDIYGFAALPGGYGSSGGGFDGVGYYGGWLSASEGNAYYAYFTYGRDMYGDNEDVGRVSYDKRVLFSVRCLQD